MKSLHKLPKLYLPPRRPRLIFLALTAPGRPGGSGGYGGLQRHDVWALRWPKDVENSGKMRSATL
eukprot:1080639-Amorphochlora_amoeboformis.AAC.2